MEAIGDKPMQMIPSNPLLSHRESARIPANGDLDAPKQVRARAQKSLVKRRITP